MLRMLVLCLLLGSPVAAQAMGQVPMGQGDEEFIGKPAPDFTLPTVSGGQTSLSQARDGKKAVLMFWATWCPHCHDAIRTISAQLDAITAKGIKVLLVDVGESKDQVKAYLQANQVPLDSFVDQDSTLQETYGLSGVPTVCFIDEQGIIRSKQYEFPSNYEEMFK